MTKRAVWPKTMALLVTVCFMGGCERQRPSEVPTPLTTHADRAATVVTPCVHPQVQCGIARQVRAYGGSFVDADRGVEIVFSTDLGQAPVLRAMFLGKAYRGRNMQQRLITAVEVRQAQFDYASLAQWRDTISERLLGKVSGVYSVGIEDDKNRVGIGLDTLRYPGLRGEVLAVLSGAGVPQDAVVFEQQLPFQFDRATPGAALGSAGALFGANDSLVDQPLPLAGGYIERVTPNILGTFGFPVTYNGQNAVVVNSHATNTLFFVDNDTIQEALDPSANTWTSIGHELLDPAGTCGTYCRYSDAALFTVDAGVSFNTGRIALTTDQVPPSTWGVPGSIAVGQGGTSFQAVTVLYPEGQVQAGDWIEKTGPMTGTTQGQLTNICRDVTVAYHGINYTFKCSGWANYYASGGDSGSPVYQSDNGAAQVLGIHFAADAVSHITVFSYWQYVASEIGGTINALTDISVGTPTMSGSISGGTALLSWSLVSATNTDLPTYYRLTRSQWNATTQQYWEPDTQIATGMTTQTSYHDTVSVNLYYGTTNPGNNVSWVKYYVSADNHGVDHSSAAVYYRITNLH